MIQKITWRQFNEFPLSAMRLVTVWRSTAIAMSADGIFRELALKRVVGDTLLASCATSTVKMQLTPGKSRAVIANQGGKIY